MRIDLAKNMPQFLGRRYRGGASCQAGQVCNIFVRHSFLIFDECDLHWLNWRALASFAARIDCHFGVKLWGRSLVDFMMRWFSAADAFITNQGLTYPFELMISEGLEANHALSAPRHLSEN
jgi:hypothetical protein